MIEEEDKTLDHLFKKRLLDTDNSFAFNEDDWASLETMLDKNEKRKRMIIWMRIGSGIAAMLLLFMGWLVFIPTPNPSKQQMVKVVKTPKSIERAVELHTDVVVKLSNANQVVKQSNVIQIQSLLRSPIQNNIAVLKKDTAIPILIAQNQAVKDSIANPIIQTIATANVVQQNQDLTKPDSNDNRPQLIKDNKLNRTQHPIFAISVVASSDLNGVNTLKNGKIGSNYGFLFSLFLTNRISIQTGVNYAVKPYQIAYSYSNAYAYKVSPLSANANCQMLDIPLNINYELLNKEQNKIAVGTGLSSYLMLHENYSYNYAPTAKLTTTNYVVQNSKNYLLSILNLSATYQHQFNKSFGLMVQPYLKVPLKEVGYSNVKLHSAGVAVGLNMNINRH
jgi:hypothetical protein